MYTCALIDLSHAESNPSGSIASGAFRFQAEPAALDLLAHELPELWRNRDVYQVIVDGRSSEAMVRFLRAVVVRDATFLLSRPEYDAAPRVAPLFRSPL